MAEPILHAHLYVPGPTPVPPEAALAQAMPMTDHRAPAFQALMERTDGRLRTLFGTGGRVVVLPSSGTGGLEAVVVNLFSPGDKVLAVVAGFFGLKWADQAQAQGLDVERLEVAWGEAVRPEAVAERLAAGGHAGVLLTQNETSTGVIQDVRAVAAAVRRVRPDAVVAVDAISGFPAARLPMDAWDVDAVVCGSQKAFMLPPGLAFVALGERALARAALERPRRYYFDLRPYLAGNVPYTPAVGLYYALERALDVLEGEGEDGRAARHETLRRIVRAGGRALGMTPLAGDDVASPTLTALQPPDGVDPREVKAAGAALGALFGGGLDRLAPRILRVGHVGYVTPTDAVGSIAALEMALAAATGRPADGRGSAAAVAAWQEARRAAPAVTGGGQGL